MGEGELQANFEGEKRSCSVIEQEIERVLLGKGLNEDVKNTGLEELSKRDGYSKRIRRVGLYYHPPRTKAIAYVKVKMDKVISPWLSK